MTLQTAESSTSVHPFKPSYRDECHTYDSIMLIKFDSSLGAAVCEELIRTTLFIVEVLSQHHTLITPFHSTVSIHASKYTTELVSDLSVICLIVNFFL